MIYEEAPIAPAIANASWWKMGCIEQHVGIVLDRTVTLHSSDQCAAWACLGSRWAVKQRGLFAASCSLLLLTV